jgi:YkoY family integral membrane protein
MTPTITSLWQEIISKPGMSLAIIANLILIESLLSVDNAAVLATMVMDLPEKDREQALKYGIWGAYIFRGLALLFASVLIKIWWLKPIGGLYLLLLVYKWWKNRNSVAKEDDAVDKEHNWWYKKFKKPLGVFWSTVVAVEIMDMAFSIDNVFAAVAFTPNILLVCIGVFIGILAMRFVAQYFVKLMHKYDFLETCAFAVIALLGFKLLLSLYTHFAPCSKFSIFIEGNSACLKSNGQAVPAGHEMVWGDIITSLLTVCIFALPILSSILFNWPKSKSDE